MAFLKDLALKVQSMTMHYALTENDLERRW